MNILSSLLDWIGNTIGADPNTLTTTDKTFVGSINEIADSIDEINENLKGIKAASTTVVSYQRSTTVSMKKSDRLLIFGSGVSSQLKGFAIAYCNGQTGIVTVSTMAGFTSVEFTTGTETFTVTNNSTSAALYLLLVEF